MRVDVIRPPWVIAGGLALPLLLRVSDADLDSERANAAGFSPIAEAYTIYWRGMVGLSLGAHLSIQAARIDEPPDPGFPLQPALYPRVMWRIGEHELVGIDAVIPIGGPLGGRG